MKRKISNLVNNLMMFKLIGFKIILKKIRLFKLIKIILNNQLKKTSFRVTVKLINFFKAVNKLKILLVCVILQNKQSKIIFSNVIKKVFLFLGIFFYHMLKIKKY